MGTQSDQSSAPSVAQPRRTWLLILMGTGEAAVSMMSGEPITVQRAIEVLREGNLYLPITLGEEEFRGLMQDLGTSEVDGTWAQDHQMPIPGERALVMTEGDGDSNFYLVNGKIPQANPHH